MKEKGIATAAAAVIVVIVVAGISAYSTLRGPGGGIAKDHATA